MQSDNIGILDSNSTEVVKYMYDAQGKQLNVTGTLAETLGKVQPFRYRGYVYDEESEMYYLRSRYYDSCKERFINADSNIASTKRVLNHNLMEYCYNRPAIFSDPDGKSPLAAFLLALIGILRADHQIANSPNYSDAEKRVARMYTVQAVFVKKASDTASQLTDKYWGNNATNYDATRANAFKHAVWNAIMTRDLGSFMAQKFATAHEVASYGNMSPYKMWYDESIVITIHDATIMDLINNKRGRMIGQSVPFYYSDEQVTRAVLSDMHENPDEYCVLINQYCCQPIR